MRTLKKAIALFMTVAMTFALVACGGADSPESAATKEPAEAEVSETAETETAENAEEHESEGAAEKRNIVIAYVFANMDENNARSLKAMQDACERINQERDDISVELIYADSQSSVDKQLADVEAMIARKPDIIHISAVDLEGSLPAVQACKEAGILVSDDRGMESDDITFHFYQNDEPSIANILKKWLKNWLEENPEEVLYTGLIAGNPAQTQPLMRNQPMKELAEEMPERVIILDEKYGNWSTSEAQAIAEDWLQAYPEMNYINTCSDDMALGAVNACSAADKLDDFLITSVDGTKIGLGLVEEGKLDLTVKTLVTTAFSMYIDTAVDAVLGELDLSNGNVITPGEAVLVPCDESTIAEYKDMD